jgi:hypothetical protein
MYRITRLPAVGFLAVAALAVLTLTACHSTTAASPPAASAAAGAAATASAASAASTSAADPTPSFSVPGTHTKIATYRISSPVSTLVVTAHVGNITVAGTSRADVSIIEQIAYSSKPPSTTRTLAGRTLTVGYTCPVQLACGVAYVIDIPSRVAVRASTYTGAIHLSGLAGSLMATTDVGYINASGLRSATASLTAHAGGITAAFTAPPTSVTASTNAGAITLRVPPGASYHVTTRDLLGKATVSVPQAASSSRTLDASTDLGAILITS